MKYDDIKKDIVKIVNDLDFTDMILKDKYFIKITGWGLLSSK